MSDTTKHLDSLSLSLLADDTLPKETAEAYHKHMETCPQCEQAFDDFQAMSFAIARLPSVEPVDGFEGFAQGIMDKLPEQDPVDHGKTIEIPQSNAKISFWANLDWKQALWYAAVCAVGFNLMYRPPEILQTEVLQEDSSPSVAATGAPSESDPSNTEVERAVAASIQEDSDSMAPASEEAAPVSGEEILSEQIDPSLYDHDFEEISFSAHIYAESEGLLTDVQLQSELQWLLDMSDLINLSVVLIQDASAYESLAAANWGVSQDAPSLAYCFMMQESLGDLIHISPKLEELSSFDTVMVVFPLV